MLDDPGWLTSFQSDSERLKALAMISGAIIVAGCASPFAKAWAADRADRRRFEIERIKLQQKLEEKIDKKKQKEARP